MQSLASRPSQVFTGSVSPNHHKMGHELTETREKYRRRARQAALASGLSGFPATPVTWIVRIPGDAGNVDCPDSRRRR
jgi:hypothetical protein